MQGRMLGWIKGFYDAKQVETEKSERARKHKEMMEVIREIREGSDDKGVYLMEIRGELAAIKDDKEKLEHFLYVDDLISFAIMLQVIDGLRLSYQCKIIPQLKQLTQDVGSVDYYTNEISESIKLFDAFLQKNKADLITRDSINDFICTERHRITNSLASTYGCDADDFGKEFNHHVEFDIALSCIHHIIKQSDMRQTAGVTAMTKEFFWLSTSKILNPYISLPHLIACLEPDAETVHLYRELNAWMKGVHFYHASLLKKELKLKEIEYVETGDGVILLVDDKPYPPMNSIVDKTMQYRFGLTFYDLARYVHDAAQVLASQLLAVTTEENAAEHAVADSSITALQHSGLFAAPSAAAAAASEEDVALESQFKPA